MTTVEREQSPLVRELEHVRALLEAFRDGEEPPEATPPEAATTASSPPSTA